MNTSEAGFTKGPWHWIGDMCIEGAKGETVLECGDDGKEWGLHSAELRISDADRALMVAAPELLKAGEEVEAAWVALATALPQDDRIEALEWGAMTRLRAAINKATGK